MSSPSVDILIATYNGEEFVYDLLASISRQTFENWNVIISDDLSSDNTVAIVEDFADRYPGRVKIIHRNVPSGSATSNFLSMLHYSESDYVMFCDQDDVWFDEKIETFVEVLLESNKNVPTLVFCDMKVVDENLREISPSFMKYSKLDPQRTDTRNLLGLACVPGCASCFNAELRKIACDTTNYSSIVMHDTWISLLASIFGEIKYIDKPLVYYRQHNLNAVGAKSYLKVFLSGLDRSKRRKTLAGTIRQAERLIADYGSVMPSDKLELIKSYSSLDSLSLFKKVATINKWHFWKFGLARKIDQLLNL